MRDFQFRWTPRGGYNPAAAIDGEQSNSVYAGLNMVLITDGERAHLEQWTGYGLFAASGANTLATGTASLLLNADVVTGAGTRFFTDLTPGQSIAINGRVFTVFRIDSDTSMVVSPKAHNTIAAQPIALLQQIQALDTRIATHIRGSIIRLPKGHLLGAGRGFVRTNGNALPGPGWILTDQPQVAVLDPVTGNYTPYRLGMVTPAVPTATPVVGGGTKGMPAATYSVRIVPYRFATDGYNNPSDPVSFTLATLGDRVDVTFPAMDTANGQDGWRIYGTKSTSTTNAMGGPWYLIRTLTSTEVAPAGGTFRLEWADGELTVLLEFDNDPPPPAAYMAALGGLPVAVGCRGQGHLLTGTATTAGPGSNVITGAGTLFTTELALNRFVWLGTNIYRILTITSATSMTVTPTPAGAAAGLAIRTAEDAPGPVLHPAKVSILSGGINADAYSPLAAVAIDPPDPILGHYVTRERIYCLTANSLAFAERNTDPATSNTNPLVTRPHWNLGFRNPRAIVAVNGYLYAFTTAGATRSAEFGDEVQTEHTFAAKVAPDMALWDPGKVTVAYSAEFESVCFMHADDGTRPGGTARYGTMLMYMLRLQEWSTPLRMEDLADVDPTYATSTATIQGQMYFASPTNLGVTNIYQLAIPNGEVGETFIAPNFSDAGADEYDKNLRYFKMTAGRTSAAPVVVDFYGTVAGGAAPVANLVAGSSSLGQKSLTVNTPVVITLMDKLYINRLQNFTMRIRFSSSGSVGARLDKLNLWGNIVEVRR